MAVTSEARHPAFAHVPTLRERGLDLVGTSWFGVSGPAGMPQPVVDRLARDIRAILGDEGMLAGFGGTPSPEGFANVVGRRWRAGNRWSANLARNLTYR